MRARPRLSGANPPWRSAPGGVNTPSTSVNTPRGVNTPSTGVNPRGGVNTPSTGVNLPRRCQHPLDRCQHAGRCCRTLTGVIATWSYLGLTQMCGVETHTRTNTAKP